MLAPPGPPLIATSQHRLEAAAGETTGAAHEKRRTRKVEDNYNTVSILLHWDRLVYEWVELIVFSVVNSVVGSNLGHMKG